MADEVAESSQGSGRMDLNLYLGLPPLPRPPSHLSLAMNCPSPLLNAASSAQEAARIDDTASFIALPEPPSSEVYSPSNALSMPEPSPFDPLLAMLSDEHSIGGEEPLDAVEPVRMAPDTSSTDVSVLLPPLPQPPPFTLLDADDLEPPVEELPQPYPADPAARRAEMVSMRELMQPTGDIEAMEPELRLQRLIHLSERHQLVRPMPGYQRGNSPEMELVRAITQSHSSLDTLRRHKPHGDGQAGGMAADHKKEGGRGCEGSFECNICLDTAKEPVVTTCGHLFCWPCLYQWLRGHSVHSECPVCKGEVLEVDVTPIYGRGGGGQVACGNDIPPRPKANRNESLRQQLLGSDSRGIASMVRQLMENPDIVRAQLGVNAGVEVTVLPSGRSRSRGRRQQRQDNNAAPSTSAVLLHVVNSTPESGNQVTLPSSNANDTTEPAAQQAPQQSSSMDQASASSTMAVIVGEVPLPMLDEVIEPEGRFRSPEPRRTRRRRQT